MMRFLALTLLFAASLAAQTCTLSVSPSLFNVSADSYAGTVQLTGTACGSYSATVPITVPWLIITGGTTGTSLPATLYFNAAANPSATARSAAITVTSGTSTAFITVTQAGANCLFGLTSTTQTYTVGGGTGTLNIQANCAWSLSADSWISFAGPTNGVTANSQTYTVAANACAPSRTGTITLVTTLSNPPTLSITQAGSPSNISLSANNVTVPSAAGTGHVSVNTGNGCTWNAASNVSWLTVTSPAGGLGNSNGTVSYSLLANTSATRTGNIQVGSGANALTYTVTQLAPAAPPVVLSAVTSAASYASDAVSPGEIVALFGSGLGPASIVKQPFSGGSATNSLGGTQVLFDGVAAPMIYTLAGQVSAVAPYSLSGKSSTQVQVQYQNQTSNTVTMPVQAAHPAIFSVDSSGVGPGAILNQDYSVNSSGNPATASSYIQIFATGGGATNPASVDGSLAASPYPLLVQPVSVTIGGVPATTIPYAGAAPGAIAGLTQIDAQVPAGVTGIALPVVIKTGNFTGNTAVTVAVK